MEIHTCSTDCITEHGFQIRNRIKMKIQNYRNSDSQPKFNGHQPTMSTKQAFRLLQDSKGICNICKQMTTLHNWERGDPLQMSFDRLNDSDTHHIENVQVVHLKCNVDKAEQQYQPDKRYYREYRDTISEYMDLNKQMPESNLLNRKECIAYLALLRKYLAYLHEVTFGPRKENKWKAQLGSDLMLTRRPSRVKPLYQIFSDEYIWQ